MFIVLNIYKTKENINDMVYFYNGNISELLKVSSDAKFQKLVYAASDLGLNTEIYNTVEEMKRRCGNDDAFACYDKKGNSLIFANDLSSYTVSGHEISHGIIHGEDGRKSYSSTILEQVLATIMDWYIDNNCPNPEEFDPENKINNIKDFQTSDFIDSINNGSFDKMLSILYSNYRSSSALPLDLRKNEVSFAFQRLREKLGESDFPFLNIGVENALLNRFQYLNLTAPILNVE